MLGFVAEMSDGTFVKFWLNPSQQETLSTAQLVASYAQDLYDARFKKDEGVVEVYKLF